jgi:type VI secretion system protein ImpK
MRLCDCFIDVLAYTKLFLRKPVHGYEEFRQRVEHLLAGSQTAAAHAGFSAEDYRSALFPVVAYIDEAVMTSEWPEAENWKKALLQKAHFGTSKAGVEFFQRLDALSAQNKTIREVYYFCLMLGFKGQYVYRPDRGGLHNVTQQTLGLLVEQAETAGLEPEGTLFPSAYQAQPVQPASKPPALSKATLLAILLPPAAIALLYLIYQLLLAQVAGNFSLLIR